MKIAPATYYAIRSRGAATRVVTDAQIVDALRGLHKGVDRKAAPESMYGYQKMWHWLRRNGFLDVARCTVARLMRSEGMRGITRAKKIRTTTPNPDGVRAPDLLNRDFTAPHPNHS
jgi:putative transposase